MPIKKDGAGKHWVELEVVVPGTPEQLWQAMATGPGNTAWFTKTTIDERVGGEIRFDLGPNGISCGEVTTWEPPHRFGYVEREWAPGAPPVATEITITGRSGNQCVVRMVHSLFSSSDDWDDQLEGFELGWPPFFDILRLSLLHFGGRRSASVAAGVNAEGDALAIWQRLARELDLAGANVGERRATPPHPERLSGVIERIHQDARQRFLIMRLEEPEPGLALVSTFDFGGRVNTNVNLYLFGDGVDERAGASEQRWRSWLGDRFAPAHR